MSCAHSWGYALPFYRGCVTKKLPPCRMCRTRTGAELPWYHLASPRSCERGLVGWCLASPRAVTGAPVAGSIFTCAAQRPSSAQRCLPASILRAFCQVPAVHTLLVKASLCVSKGQNTPFLPYNTQKRWVCQLENCLHLVIQADAVFIVGAHFAVGDGDMSRMGGVALECLGGLEGGVQH